MYLDSNLHVVVPRESISDVHLLKPKEFQLKLLPLFQLNFKALYHIHDLHHAAVRDHHGIHLRVHHRSRLRVVVRGLHAKNHVLRAKNHVLRGKNHVPHDHRLHTVRKRQRSTPTRRTGTGRKIMNFDG